MFLKYHPTTLREGASFTELNPLATLIFFKPASFFNINILLCSFFLFTIVLGSEKDDLLKKKPEEKKPSKTETVQLEFLNFNDLDYIEKIFNLPVLKPELIKSIKIISFTKGRMVFSCEIIPEIELFIRFLENWGNRKIKIEPSKTDKKSIKLFFSK